jgi:hypothetical protein
VKQALCIGKLTHLEIIQPGGSGRRTIRLKNRWLAWDAGRRCFHICKVTGRANTNPTGAVAKAHRRFHATAPSAGTFRAEVPDTTGGLVDVGLLRSLVYEVPQVVKSPGKNRYHWHHAFGDTGHKGGSDYPEKVLPMLKKTRSGEYVIVRRVGNIFKVDTWLRG